MASAPAYCFSSMRLLASASRSEGSPACAAAAAPALAGRTGVPPVLIVFDVVLRLAVRGIDAQYRFIGFLGLGVPLLPRPLAPKLQIDSRGLVLHVFLQTEFCHALLRIEIGGVLADNLFVVLKVSFGFAFLG